MEVSNRNSSKINEDSTPIAHKNKNNNSNNELSILEIKSSDNDSLNQPYLTTFFNIKYKRFGQVIAFNFDSLNNPKFVIGPTWGFFFALMMFTLLGGGLIYYYFISKLLPLFYQIIYCLFFTNLIGVYTINFLINPGVILKNKYDTNRGKYCLVCKIYVPNELKGDHCSICDVCIEDLDHHCVWMTKCVGRRNKKWFFSYIFSFALFYSTILGGVIYYNFKNGK